jgi:hypothetical protein
MNYAYNNQGMQNMINPNIMIERARQNNLINSYNNFNQNSYSNQMNKIFTANPILNQPIVQLKQEQIVNQMKNFEEIELVKKLQKQVRNKEIDEVEMLRQLVIMPIKIEKKNEDVEPRYDFVKGTWEHERAAAWAKKTNQPYKIIIPQKKDESDKIGFDYKQKIIEGEKEKLTIHKVTELDKNRKKWDKEHRLKKRDHKELNKENKLTYSLDNYTKHKKNFDYEHIYTFKIKHIAKSHDDLKFDRIKYHEEKQKEREKGRLLKDKILESLDDDNIINEEENNNVEYETKQIDNDDDINVDDLLKEVLETQDIIDDEESKIEKNKTADYELEQLLNETEDVQDNTFSTGEDVQDNTSSTRLDVQDNTSSTGQDVQDVQDNIQEEELQEDMDELDYISKLLEEAGIN